MWNNNKTTLLFMAIALVGFIWVKILPYFPDRPEHETGKISLPEPNNRKGCENLSGCFVSVDSDTLSIVGVIRVSENSDFQKWDGSLAKKEVILVPVNSDSITTVLSEDENKFDIAAIDSSGNIISIWANSAMESATGNNNKSDQWLITNPGYFESKHITEECTFAINPIQK